MPCEIVSFKYVMLRAICAVFMNLLQTARYLLRLPWSGRIASRILISLWALVATAEALNHAGITDPCMSFTNTFVLQRSEMSLGSGIGGMMSLAHVQRSLGRGGTQRHFTKRWSFLHHQVSLTCIQQFYQHHRRVD